MPRSFGRVRSAMLLALALTLGLATQAGAQQERLPNIVLIISDDHGTDALGAYGSATAQTPALDALAADGVVFDAAYTTTSSCSPSRSAILTGQFPHRNGMMGLTDAFAVHPRVRTLPERLRRTPLRTAIAGKLHLRPVDQFPFAVVLSDPDGRPPREWRRDPVSMASVALDWIDADAAPFFLLFGPTDPHRIFDQHLPSGANGFGNLMLRPLDPIDVTFDPAAIEVPAYLPDLPEVRDELAQYLTSVARVDRGIGALIDGLRERGLYDDTLIIYVSDNGPAFVGAKTELYDPGIRLPMIIRAPRMAARGVRVEQPVSFIDITPTVLDAVGIELPARMRGEGVSLLPLIEEGAAPTRSTIFGSHTFHSVDAFYPMRMAVTEEWKLIWNVMPELEVPLAVDLAASISWQTFTDSEGIPYGVRARESLRQRPEFELYDRRADPQEARNLADLPEYRAIRDELFAEILAMQERTRDPFRSHPEPDGVWLPPRWQR